MDNIIKQIKADIVSVRKYKKELEQKMVADAKIEGVDLFPHYCTLSRFDGIITGLKTTLVYMKKGK